MLCGEEFTVKSLKNCEPDKKLRHSIKFIRRISNRLSEQSTWETLFKSQGKLLQVFYRFTVKVPDKGIPKLLEISQIQRLL